MLSGKDRMIDKDLFDELAQTGALKLDPEESETLRTELNKEFALIRQLETVPLGESICPVVHGKQFPAHIRCELREDEWIPFADAAGIIAQAPLSRDGFIVSPEIVHLKLDL